MLKDDNSLSNEYHFIMNIIYIYILYNSMTCHLKIGIQNEEPDEDCRGITSALFSHASSCILCKSASLNATRERDRNEGFRNFNLRAYNQAAANACIKQTSTERQRKGWSSDVALRATDCSWIRRKTRCVTRCVGAEFVIRTYVRTHVRLHIHPADISPDKHAG